MITKQKIKYLDPVSGSISDKQTIGSIPITKDGLVPYTKGTEQKTMTLDEYFKK